jgi:hypothetical protein
MSVGLLLSSNNGRGHTTAWCLLCRDAHDAGFFHNRNAINPPSGKLNGPLSAPKIFRNLDAWTHDEVTYPRVLKKSWFYPTDRNLSALPSIGSID